VPCLSFGVVVSEPAGRVAPSPFDQHYGLELSRCSEELVQGSTRVEPHLTQVSGLVHGGVYAAMAETLASLGTNAAVSSEGMLALGASNSTSFVRPIAEGTIHGTARRRHRGRTTWIWDVEFTDSAGRLCAMSRVSLAVRSAEEAESRVGRDREGD
jgi:1,4-dihydroxy-2-naphthoyl-CoA hydrolase